MHRKMPVCAISANGKESWKMIQDPWKKPNRHKNLIDSFLGHMPHLPTQFRQKPPLITFGNILHKKSLHADLYGRTDRHTHTRPHIGIRSAADNKCVLICLYLSFKWGLGWTLVVALPTVFVLKNYLSSMGVWTPQTPSAHVCSGHWAVMRDGIMTCSRMMNFWICIIQRLHRAAVFNSVLTDAWRRRHSCLIEVGMQNPVPTICDRDQSENGYVQNSKSTGRSFANRGGCDICVKL